MNRPALGRWRRLLAPVLAVSAVIAGTAFVAAPRQPIGWFAYLSQTDLPFTDQMLASDQLVLMDSGARVGYLLIAVGLLTLAFWLGYRLAVRRTPSAG